MPELKPRSRLIPELIENSLFIIHDRPIEIDEKAAELLTLDAKSLLRDLAEVLETLKDWNRSTIETAIRGYVAENEIKLGSVAQPLRAGLTGRTVSPGIFEVLTILGREESLGRMSDAVKA